MKSCKGFTLIELLIVITVLGVLATVVIVAINPIQQLARGRDAGRKSVVGQLSRAMQAMFISRSGSFPPMSASWMNTLQASAEINTPPPVINYALHSPCTSTPQVVEHNFYCYSTDFTEAIIFATLESQSDNSRCDQAAGENAYFLWSSADGGTGIVCETSEPSRLSGYTFKQ